MKDRSHRFTGRRRGVLALGFVFMIAWAGCVSLQPVASMPVPVARVAVANLTDYTWEISMRTATDGEPRAERLTPRSIAQWNLATGDYVIEQRLANPAATTDAVRRFTARFVAGEDYKWSLATLHSPDTGEVAVSQP